MDVTLTPKRVLVCGATGYLGGHVCIALKNAGYIVRALARDKTKFTDEVRESVDEVFEGQATGYETLEGVANDCEVVFSSIGIRSAARRPTFWDVDRDANVNIVKRCIESKVKHIVFTSAFKADEVRDQSGVAEARESVVDLIMQSDFEHWNVIRPTGFFNDAGEFFGMAKTGRGWLIGDGNAKINFIHGADIASGVVNILQDEAKWNKAIGMGGPDIYTWREVYEIAFDVLGTQPRLSSVPIWFLRFVGFCVYPFNTNVHGLIQGFASLASGDVVAPVIGTHHLRDFFETL